MQDHLWTFRAKLIRVVDGDTLDLDIDQGLYVHSKQRLRLLGVDAPENQKSSQNAHMAATAYVLELFSLYQDSCIIKTSKSDSFGRWLADVYFIADDGAALHLNSLLIENGYAEEYKK